MSKDEDVPEASEEVEEQIEVPEEWEQLPIEKWVEEGWKYRLKTKRSGAQYMCLRFKNQERSLGRYAPELEKLLFKLYPKLESPTEEKSRSKKPFLSVRIKRVAVVPSDYRPTIEIIRYFQVFKNNGFPGDFSDFINGNVMDHFVRCNGVILPVLLEETKSEEI